MLSPRSFRLSFFLLLFLSTPRSLKVVRSEAASTTTTTSLIIYDCLMPSCSTSQLATSQRCCEECVAVGCSVCQNPSNPAEGMCGFGCPGGVGVELSSREQCKSLRTTTTTTTRSTTTSITHDCEMRTCGPYVTSSTCCNECIDTGCWVCQNTANPMKSTCGFGCHDDVVGFPVKTKEQCKRFGTTTTTKGATTTTSTTPTTTPLVIYDCLMPSCSTSQLATSQRCCEECVAVGCSVCQNPSNPAEGMCGFGCPGGVGVELSSREQCKSLRTTTTTTTRSTTTSITHDCEMRTCGPYVTSSTCCNECIDTGCWVCQNTANPMKSTCGFGCHDDVVGFPVKTKEQCKRFGTTTTTKGATTTTSTTPTTASTSDILLDCVMPSCWTSQLVASQQCCQECIAQGCSVCRNPSNPAESMCWSGCPSGVGVVLSSNEQCKSLWTTTTTTTTTTTSTTTSAGETTTTTSTSTTTSILIADCVMPSCRTSQLVTSKQCCEECLAGSCTVCLHPANPMESTCGFGCHGGVGVDLMSCENFGITATTTTLTTPGCECQTTTATPCTCE